MWASSLGRRPERVDYPGIGGEYVGWPDRRKCRRSFGAWPDQALGLGCPSDATLRASLRPWRRAFRPSSRLRLHAASLTLRVSLLLRADAPPPGTLAASSCTRAFRRARQRVSRRMRTALNPNGVGLNSVDRYRFSARNAPQMRLRALLWFRAPAHPRTRAPAHPRTPAPPHPRTRAPPHPRTTRRTLPPSRRRGCA